MKQTTTVHGHIVDYDDVTAKYGIHFLLYSLNAQEAKVFFNEAFRNHTALFEDQMDRKYKLIYHTNRYELVKA